MKRSLIAVTALILVMGSCGGGSDGKSDVGAKSPEPTPQATSTFDPEALAALEEALISAYTGAAAYSSTNDNYFARTRKEQGELSAAVSSELVDLSFGVGSGYAMEEEELTWCSRYDDAPMVRIRTSEAGDDLILAASDLSALLTLTYVPGETEPTISAPTECVPLRGQS